MNSDPNFIPGVQAFTYNAQAFASNGLASLTSPPVTPAGNIPVTAGQVIQLQVVSIFYTTSEFGGDQGPFSLNVWLETPQSLSPNDYFANRPEITTPTYYFDGSIYGATNEPGEPLPAPGDYQTLWWDFVPPSPGILTVTLSSPDFPSTATLYDGTNLASLIPQTGLPCSVLVYAVQTNHQYALQVASAPSITGSFSLDTRFDPQAYDNFETPEPLVGTNITINRNNIAATLEPGEPQLNGDSGHTLWYSWTAPFTGRVDVSSQSCCARPNLAVYTGSVLTNLTLVTGDTSFVSFYAVSNTVYELQASGTGGRADAFSLTLSATPYLPAPNDNFTNSIILGPTGGGGGGTISFATTEPGEPTYFGGAACKSLWWTWQVPVNSYVYIANGQGLATNIVYAAYTGSSVDALTLVGIGTNGAYFPANGGTVLQIAAVVAESMMGDVQFSLHPQATGISAPVPGNLLCEGSFENTGLNLTCWQVSGSIGGYVNENGGADGTTWPTLGSNTSISQSFATVPGQNYLVNFATEGGTSLQVSWDSNILGVVNPPSWWFWTNYMVTASNTTSRLTFYNNGGGYPALDGVSVVWMNEPPAIITPPSSASTLAGGDVTFLVGAQGSPSLSFQWYFNNSPLMGQTGDTLELDQVSLTQSGQYYVIVSNAFGVASNTPVTLVVEPTNQLVLVLQPSGGAVAIGGYYDLSAAASGPGLITYQWYLNNAPIAGATNQELVFNPFQATNAGTYQVIAQCGLQSVLSLPATLTPTNYNGGGTVFLDNDFYIRSTEYYEPIYDVDGVNMLSSAVSDYVAQLYAGPALTQLSPAGNLTTFYSDPDSIGLFIPETVTIPNVPVRSNAFMQIRVWDRKNGLSYEEARALGGKFGHSTVLQIITGGIPPNGSPYPPPNMVNLTSFSLQAGTPQFTAGVIKPAGYQTNGVPVWSLLGNANSLNVIMSSTNNLAWQSMLVITNVTGTVTFVDPSPPSTNCVFYRARILD